MKLSRVVVFVGTACLPRIAAAGGLFLPGSGAVSTSRAGAAVASADDGEALALNPAGIAKSTGNTITISAAMIQYAMEFQRRGTYDPVPGETYPYAGQPFAAEQNDASPPLGIGSVQPVPVIAFLTDLGGRVPGLHLGVGLYAPNAYPFRDMCTKRPAGCQKLDPQHFNDDPNQPPPPARYDIMKQDAAVILPSLAVAYRILPNLDVGVRLSAGQAQLQSTTALWGSPGPNYEEDIKKDAVFAVDAKDSFVPAFGIGVAYRPTPNIELGANYTSEIDVHASGTATSTLGPSAGLPGATIDAVPDAAARCATGGTASSLKACIDLALPMTVQLGGRYKFLDANGRLEGDVELDLNWENWGKTCSLDEIDSGSCTNASDYRVVVDAQPVLNGQSIGLTLKTSDVEHGLQNTYGVRLGGSYRIAVGAKREHDESNELILRGGLGYDTAAAKTGWLRADLDGAARTTIALGAAYRTERFEVSLGGGAVLEGSPSNPNVGGAAQPCNPTAAMPSCGAGARQGPDPINPLFDPGPANQVESPVTQGDYKSHYLLFMLGVSTWF
jgi:long-subunit fatty acid transport protein